jgi:hypothetical protein
MNYLLCTPILNYTTKDKLLRIVSNIRTETIHHTSKMPIPKLDNLRDRHGRLER